MKWYSSPIRTARFLAENGDRAGAERLLAELKASSPLDANVVHAERLLHAQLAATGKAGGVTHRLVGWSCLVLAVGVVGAPIFWAINYLDSVWQPANPDAPLGIGFFLGLLAMLVYLAYGTQYLFFRLWFWYLAALPAAIRPLAEGKLALSMTLSDFEPLYSGARRRMYRGDT